MNFSGRVEETHPEKFIAVELLFSGIFAQKSCKVEFKRKTHKVEIQKSTKI